MMRRQDSFGFNSPKMIPVGDAIATPKGAAMGHLAGTSTPWPGPPDTQTSCVGQ